MGSTELLMLATQLRINTRRNRRDKYQSVKPSSAILFLEKADNSEGGQVTLKDIRGALDEFQRLYKAGIASEAEILTLARAFPENPRFSKAASALDADKVMVVGGPASVEMIDREGHLITTAALSKAFDKYMDNFRTRNAMVLHSDVQVGWALPAYINKSGQIFKSGPSSTGLYFITEVRKDTKVADKVREQIDEGKLRSYSIAGSAIKVQNMQKGLMPYMQVDEMELAEVTVCEKGVNQGASFDILKAESSDKHEEEEDHHEEERGVTITRTTIQLSDDGTPDYLSTFLSSLNMVKASTEWSANTYQKQRDLDMETGSHLQNEWGPAGLSNESNITALKNFIGD